MASFGGLISGVMGRAAEGYGKAADMEMKKQSELDLRKQLMEAETEKQLRIDEIKRGRDIAEEDRKMGPEYLAKVSTADLTKAQNAIANRKTLAPSAAEAADVEFEAGKGLEGKKATAATTAKITEAGSLAGDAGYLKNIGDLAMAAQKPALTAAQMRADAVSGKSSGGGSGAIKARSTYTDDKGMKVAVMSDGSTKVLGKSADYDKTVSNIILKMTKEDSKFRKLPASEQRTKAEEILRGQIVVPSSGKDLTGLNDPKYLRQQRDATAD
jgi:hypothetical protein